MNTINYLTAFLFDIDTMKTVICFLCILSIALAAFAAHLMTALEEVKKINVELTKTSEHWNNKSTLPPVGIPLFILTCTGKVSVIRKSWVSDRDQALEFTSLETGNLIIGKYQWQYQ